MLGPEDLILCCGTVRQASFGELIDAASGAGFQGISVQPHLYDQERARGSSDAEIRRWLADAGLEIAELDALLTWLPGAPAPTDLGDELGRSLFRRTAEDFFRIAEAIGGRSLNVAQVFPAEIDVDVAAEALAGICDGAAGVGLSVSLEFLPWTGIPDAKTALAIVERAGRENAGLMIDSWHVFRGAGGPGALASIPGERVVGVQLSDAPTEPGPVPAIETMEARLPPGDGDIDLVGLVRTLDSVGSRAPIGIEVYSSALAAGDPAEVAQRVAVGTRELLARARA
jgi:sugar phosphate isomerase/epimerase